jgi:hypothetical protein
MCACFDSDTRTSVCIEQPLIDPFGNAESSRYYCSENGTMLHYQVYNSSGCADLFEEGIINVPASVGSTLIDCVCQESKSKYVKVQSFLNESSQPGECKGNEVDIALVLSGTCFGYTDDITPMSMFITCSDADEVQKKRKKKVSFFVCLNDHTLNSN